MRAEIAVFVATSLDGYIARSDGSMDWLNEANRGVPRGEDCGYAAFVATVDVLVMGRASFEQVLTFESWPYDGLKVIVLTHRALTLPAHLSEMVTASSETPATLVQRLSAQGAKRIYVDGGKTIQAFLAADLIDNLTLTVVPVMIGTGRPLFGPARGDGWLVLESVKTYAFGFVQSRYRVRRSSQAPQGG